MKILKPGKVELRKFVCPKCRCEFAATHREMVCAWAMAFSLCPTCKCSIHWEDGEHYEEPVQDTQTDRGRLVDLLDEMGLLQAEKLASFLIRNGVTFREE